MIIYAKIRGPANHRYQCMHSDCEHMRERPVTKRICMPGNRTNRISFNRWYALFKSSGWITFRMRAMLVSCSYHLWLDWRDTGHHLARTFTDYEPGIHYENYKCNLVSRLNALRIYNPIKQSQEHDPEGIFIKRWVPELKNVPVDFIHEPWTMPPMLQKACNFEIGKDYPKPIVDHALAIKAARDKLSEIRKQSDFKAKASQVYQKLGSRKKADSRPKKTKKKPDDGQLSFDFD